MDRQSLYIAVFTVLTASLTPGGAIADESGCTDSEGCAGLFSEGCRDWVNNRSLCCGEGEGGGCGEGCGYNQSLAHRRMSFYTSLSLGASFADLQSGGFNTVGVFPNTGSDGDDSFDIGGALGIAIPTERGQLRLECEALSRDAFNTVTNSFQPPTPTFFYNVDFEKRWSVMANMWYDIPVDDDLDVYIGGGIGSGGGTISLNDTIVTGQGSYTETIWQFGTGLNWHCSDHLTIDFGYRFVDYGTAEIGLTFVGAPAGNYTADLTAHQLQLGFRFRSIGDLLRGN